ncbi:nucleotide exchange factor GrpE [Alsobacter soli]|uniref:Protein GrpE n=1 Tax=Alsobacter soli TaxID=2109933 RepID=A0A2T1HTF3_9HYPH|nr:nucleotide exchange factor GrpE [Alsobacter soli]PSC04935.1 nucleotide exchange factor GrpE [Alsobacter soli]
MTQPDPQTENAVDTAADGPEASAGAGAQQGGEPERDIHSVIEALNAENASLKDKVLRTLAEMENLRRRTEKEVADARAYATTNFAKDMLTVADNLRRALESLPAEAAEAADQALKALKEGVELTERDLLKTLERHGIRRIDPKGEKFDPNFHQAMFEVQNPAVPHGSVFEVVQPGFVIGERVLRPALVGVARGGPKPGANGADASVDKQA